PPDDPVAQLLIDHLRFRAEDQWRLPAELPGVGAPLRLALAHGTSLRCRTHRRLSQDWIQDPKIHNTAIAINAGAAGYAAGPRRRSGAGCRSRRSRRRRPAPGQYGALLPAAVLPGQPGNLRRFPQW